MCSWRVCCCSGPRACSPGADRMVCASLRGNLLLAAAAVAIGCMPLFASNYHMQLATSALIAATFALSLQLLVGGAGMVSLAQAAFFGMGAYSVYLLGRML